MRLRIAATPIELRKPERQPQPRVRGIAIGVLLGATAWVALVALGLAIWTWLAGR